MKLETPQTVQYYFSTHYWRIKRNASLRYSERTTNEGYALQSTITLYSDKSLRWSPQVYFKGDAAYKESVKMAGHGWVNQLPNDPL